MVIIKGTSLNAVFAKAEKFPNYRFSSLKMINGKITLKGFNRSWAG